MPTKRRSGTLRSHPARQRIGIVPFEAYLRRGGTLYARITRVAVAAVSTLLDIAP